MKKSTKITLAALGGAAVLIAAVVVAVFALLNHQKNADFYTLGEDRIPTVKAVVGVRDLTGVSFSYRNGELIRVYQYRSDTGASDMERYLSYLAEREGFAPVAGSGGRHYARTSAEAGKVLAIHITDNGLGYTLTIQKGAGTLTGALRQGDGDRFDRCENRALAERRGPYFCA